MKEFRATKYNPYYRDSNGHFVKQEWTSYSDIGKIIGGKLLTYEDYIKIENKYIDAVIKTMKFINIEFIFIKGLEVNSIELDIHSTEGMRKIAKEIKKRKEIQIAEVSDLCRLILREYIWARLECAIMFIHFGYDYYMYLGIQDEFSQIINEIDLFVEPMNSPYKV